MAKFSREKGKRGEREWAQYLCDQGFSAHRGVQFQGGKDSPDVKCAELDAILHFEVKRTESLSLYPAMRQAQCDAGARIPTVIHRRNDQEWLVVLKASDFITLIKSHLNGQKEL